MEDQEKDNSDVIMVEESPPKNPTVSGREIAKQIFNSPIIQKRSRELIQKALRRNGDSSLGTSSLEHNDSSDFKEAPKLRKTTSSLKLKSNQAEDRKKESTKLKGQPTLMNDARSSSATSSRDASSANKQLSGATDAEREVGSPEGSGPATNDVQPAGSSLKSCILCGCHIALKAMEEHRRACLIHRFSKSSGPASDSEIKEQKKCDVCQKIISGLSLKAQSQHINKCLDQVERDKQAETDHSALLLKARESVLPCPMCQKNFKSVQSRKLHVKRCAKDKGMMVDRLKSMMQQQEEGHIAKLDAGILPEGFLSKVTEKKAPAKPRKKKVAQPKTLQDEQTQLALALSSSLVEERRDDFANISLQPVLTRDAYGIGLQAADRKVDIPKGKKGKQSESSSLLLSSTKVTAAQRISSRVDSYIFSNGCNQVLTKTPPFKTKSKLSTLTEASQVNLELGSSPEPNNPSMLWQKTSMHEKAASTESANQQNLANTESVNHRPNGVHTACENVGRLEYYVGRLMPPVQVSCVAPGSKVKRVSAIPGRRQSSEVKGGQALCEGSDDPVDKPPSSPDKDALQSCEEDSSPSEVASQTLQDLVFLAMENKDSFLSQSQATQPVLETVENNCILGVAGSTPAQDLDQSGDSDTFGDLSESSEDTGSGECMEHDNKGIRRAQEDVTCGTSNSLVEHQENEKNVPSPPLFPAHLVNNSKFSDVSILVSVGGEDDATSTNKRTRNICAHKIILFAQCPQLLELCENGEGDVDVINLSDDYGEQAVLDILRFIYCGEGGVCWKSGCLDQIIHFAHRFQMPCLGHTAKNQQSILTFGKQQSLEQHSSREGQKSLEQNSSSEGQKSLEQHGSREGQKSIEQQSSREGKKSLEQQSSREGQKSLEQHGSREGQKSIEQQSSREGKKSLEQQSSREGKKSLEQHSSREGKKSLEQQSSREGQKYLEQQSSREGQKYLEQQSSREGQKSLEQHSSSDGQEANHVPIAGRRDEHLETDDCDGLDQSNDEEMSAACGENTRTCDRSTDDAQHLMDQASQDSPPQPIFYDLCQKMTVVLQKLGTDYKKKLGVDHKPVNSIDHKKAVIAFTNPENMQVKTEPKEEILEIKEENKKPNTSNTSETVNENELQVSNSTNDLIREKEVTNSTNDLIREKEVTNSTNNDFEAPNKFVIPSLGIDNCPVGANSPVDEKIVKTKPNRRKSKKAILSEFKNSLDKIYKMVETFGEVSENVENCVDEESLTSIHVKIETSMTDFDPSDSVYYPSVLYDKEEASDDISIIKADIKSPAHKKKAGGLRNTSKPNSKATQGKTNLKNKIGLNSFSPNVSPPAPELFASKAATNPTINHSATTGSNNMVNLQNKEVSSNMKTLKATIANSENVNENLAIDSRTNIYKPIPQPSNSAQLLTQDSYFSEDDLFSDDSLSPKRSLHGNDEVTSFTEPHAKSPLTVAKSKDGSNTGSSPFFTLLKQNTLNQPKVVTNSLTETICSTSESGKLETSQLIKKGFVTTKPSKCTKKSSAPLSNVSSFQPSIWLASKISPQAGEHFSPLKASSPSVSSASTSKQHIKSTVRGAKKNNISKASTKNAPNQIQGNVTLQDSPASKSNDAEDNPLSDSSSSYSTPRKRGATRRGLAKKDSPLFKIINSLNSSNEDKSAHVSPDLGLNRTPKSTVQDDGNESSEERPSSLGFTTAKGLVRKSLNFNTDGKDTPVTTIASLEVSSINGQKRSNDMEGRETGFYLNTDDHLDSPIPLRERLHMNIPFTSGTSSDQITYSSSATQMLAVRERQPGVTAVASPAKPLTQKVSVSPPTRDDWLSDVGGCDGVGDDDIDNEALLHVAAEAEEWGRVNSQAQIIPAKTPNHPKIVSLSKHRNEPSPFTPMPPYDSMNTPALKKAVEKIGVKPLGKKRNRELLKTVYHKTHQYETDSDYEPTPVKHPRLDNAQRHKAGINGSALGTSVSGSSHNTDRRINSPSKAAAPKASSEDARVDLQSHEDENICLSQDSTSSDGPDLPEESILQGWPDDEVEPTQLTQTSAELQTENLVRFMQSNPEIHEDILMYRPLELDVIKKKIAEAGMRISMEKLMDFLDERCITFTLKNMSNRNQKQGKKKEKASKKSALIQTRK